MKELKEPKLSVGQVVYCDWPANGIFNIIGIKKGKRQISREEEIDCWYYQINYPKYNKDNELEEVWTIEDNLTPFVDTKMFEKIESWLDENINDYVDMTHPMSDDDKKTLFIDLRTAILSQK